MPKAAAPRIVEVRIGDARDALDRFEAGWNRRLEERGIRELRVLSVIDLPLLLRTLTPARLELLGRLGREGPLSIYELARRLGRDYKNVHGDVSRLAELGLIERPARGALRLACDVIRAELAVA